VGMCLFFRTHIKTMSYRKSNSQTDVCPITLNSQANIRNAGHACFKVKNENGRVVQIYDAKALAEWLESNEEYPHKGKPSEEDMRRLASLVPGFIPKPVVVIDRYDFFRLAPDAPVGRFNSISVPELKRQVYALLRRKLCDDISQLAVRKNGTTKVLGEKRKKRVGIAFKDVSMLDEITSITLTEMFVDDTNYVDAFFKVTIGNKVKMLWMQMRFAAGEQRCETQWIDTYKVKYNHDDDNSRHVFSGEEPIYPSFGLRTPDGSQSAGAKEHTLFNGRKYLVRHGVRGGRFILVKGEKKYC
jgi:hypothetical protein